ncbi:Nucleotidyl transferase [Candidatus Ruthia magnifica str. Cm (Calyptogena magnifica)]|uniref:Nucleotidyl transferase n=1 Tax=Ruthia magnifica subsp. Calyptogena magnifica TaxID=413404 RepID=A1AWB6_RUTMC|nr:nucleotidyltransferase family protein [Candidatus Ruthturnera calyptogenae]ABL02223.1 Nucleotidyl transferase [Candidatus Ruthia magnifica str. Cm (Calyptogena magnifica)]
MFGMILAAGRGKRMMPLTKNIPKPLIKVRDLTLIEHSINALKNSGITKIVINISHLGEQIKSYLGNGSKFGVNIHYSDESKGALETAGGIIKALPLLGINPFVVINSDVLCDYDLSTLTLPINSLAHLVLIDNPKHNPAGDFSLNNTQLILANTKTYTFSGIGIYHPTLFKFYLFEKKLALSKVLKVAIAKNQISAEHYTGYWQDIGTPKRLELANKLVRLNVK